VTKTRTIRFLTEGNSENSWPVDKDGRGVRQIYGGIQSDNAILYAGKRNGKTLTVDRVRLTVAGHRGEAMPSTRWPFEHKRE
jgi:hypothetical protein